ncbi:MAG: rod shape-determining protein MreC [Acidobacteriia bacterium]|nr:rod shape-determining protein MreC [Terriglobia bacterium]
MGFARSPEFQQLEHPPVREAPEKVQAFVSRHRAFFLLLALMVAQILLLSAQITRNHKARLIQVWAVAVMDPFERAFHGALDGTTGAVRTYRDLWAAQQENRELRVRLTAAQREIQDLTEQAAEARRLRTLLKFKERLPFPTLAAEVIGASPGEASKTIYIDKGSDAGLTTDLGVFTPEGIVGKTIAVFPHTAQVLLITDPSSGAAAALEKSRVQGIVKGAAVNACQLYYVMNEATVEVAEHVLTSGLDQIYPKGLPIGTVSEVREGNIYKTIIIKPAASLDSLESVLVVQKPRSADVEARNAPSHP